MVHDDSEKTLQVLKTCKVLKQKKPHISVRLSGSTRIRTADPLLVRQMLWTSWAMLPCLRTYPFLIPLYRFGIAKIGSEVISPNSFSKNFFLNVTNGSPNELHPLSCRTLRRRRFADYGITLILTNQRSGCSWLAGSRGTLSVCASTCCPSPIICKRKLPLM